MPGYRSGCSSEPSRSVTILTTLVGASGSAGVDIADAAENGVAAVLAVSIGAVAKEYVVAVSARPDVLSFWKVFSPRWVAAVTADARRRGVGERAGVCTPSRCSCSMPSDRPNRRSPNPGSCLPPAPPPHLYSKRRPRVERRPRSVGCGFAGSHPRCRLRRSRQDGFVATAPEPAPTSTRLPVRGRRVGVIAICQSCALNNRGFFVEEDSGFLVEEDFC